MTNSQKYKTAEERANAFTVTCAVTKLKHQCEDALSCTECHFNWLDLEYKDEILPCPFCGEECVCGGGYVECLNDNCCYSSGNRERGDGVAIAAHNRVARAVMEAKKSGEVK